MHEARSEGGMQMDGNHTMGGDEDALCEGDADVGVAGVVPMWGFRCARVAE